LSCAGDPTCPRSERRLAELLAAEKLHNEADEMETEEEEGAGE
jgi:hypothetical protein